MRARRVSVALSVLVVIVLLVTVGAAWQGWLPWQRKQPATSAHIASVNLARDNLYCPTAAVWSPDAQHIAILAQLGACTNSDLGIVEPNVIALFSTQGRLERLLYPDTVTLGKDAPITPRPTPTASTFPQIVPTYARYWTMSWSPDGKWLALAYETTFAHDQTSNADYGKIDFGVALLAANGTTGDKLSQQTQSGGDIWDLQTRQYIHSGTANLPVALAYQWSSQGTLIPGAESSPSGPIGNPAGGQAFTIWQPGNVFLDRQKHTLTFSTITTAWSPDGRYLVPYLGFGGEMTPGVSGIVPASNGSYQFAPRDEGLLAASSQLNAPADPYATFMPVAWRGDGHLLAAREPNLLIDQVVQNLDTSIVPSATEHVVIYDCATGAKRLTLATKPLANRLQYVVLLPQPLLRWSPSGKQLLLLNAPFDSLTIWNVSVN